MRRFFGAGIAAVLVFGLGSTLHDSTTATAAVAPSGGFTVDCDNQTDFNTSLDAITWPGTDLVVTALIDDTFVITNSGTANCGFSSGTALDTDSVAIANGAPRTVTVANSGSFTLTPSGGTATTFYVDACSLDGSGISTDPWLVGTAADFKVVGAESTTTGETSCSLAGHYLQTANLTGVDVDADPTWIVGDVFTGTYDGDHYSISFTSPSYASREPLFYELGPNGLIRKLRLTGNIKTTTTDSAGLVEYLFGGTLSEIHSSVVIEVDDSNGVVGGLASHSGGDADHGEAENQDAFIRYSKFDGRIDWLDNDASVEGPIIGGLVGMQTGTGVLEIRDSYSRGSISFDSSDLTATDPDAAVYAGGLVGSDGLNDLAALNTSDGDRTFAASEVRIVRSYFAGSFSNTCEGSAATCNTDTPSHVFTGGIFGVSEDLDDTDDLLVSAFWLSSSATNAVGEIVDGGNQPLDYTAATPALPEAPPLSAALLKTITTYQSEEGATSGLPSGDADLTIGDSTDGTLTEEDYRWAIEAGNIQTFVASDYTDDADYLTRQLFDDTTVSQTYRREGAGDLTVHGGDDPESVTGYPTLGRVWEICTYANDGYPVLVWEEEDCAAPGSGSSERTQAQEARSLGFTEEEYLRFLASGLKWEEFTLQLQAERGAALASTGPSAQRLGLAAAGALGLLLGGVALLVAGRRHSRTSSSS